MGDGSRAEDPCIGFGPTKSLTVSYCTRGRFGARRTQSLTPEASLHSLPPQSGFDTVPGTVSPPLRCGAGRIASRKQRRAARYP
jgi:hypothetical protein